MAGDVEDISRYGMGVKEASRPEPVHLSWTVSGKGAEAMSCAWASARTSRTR